MSATHRWCSCPEGMHAPGCPLAPQRDTRRNDEATVPAVVMCACPEAPVRHQPQCFFSEM